MTPLRCFTLPPLVVLLAAGASAETTPGVAGHKIVDLTHSFDQQTIYWPTEAGFQLQQGPAGVTERGYFYAANRFAAAEHGGTHLDAPFHFAQGGQTVDRVPLSRLVGHGACIDVTSKCAADRDYMISVEDLKDWEEKQGESLNGKIVLLNTGFAQRWPDRERYLGVATTGRAAVAQLHFPGLDPAAANWLATARQVKAVGIDTASIDHGPSRDFHSHVNLFRHNVPALENLASLCGLPASGFTVVALPMKIAQGTGAPCRVIALLDE